MSDLENKLVHYGFLKPHKGYLVNYKYIECINPTSILLQNGMSVPVSKHRLKEIKQIFLALVSKEPDLFSPYTYEPNC